MTPHVIAACLGSLVGSLMGVWIGHVALEHRQRRALKAYVRRRLDKLANDQFMSTYLHFIEAAMNNAQYEKTEDGDWFASVPGLAGLWASGATIESTRKDLYEALDGWIEVTVKTGSRVPTVDGVSLYDDLRGGSMNDELKNRPL